MDPTFYYPTKKPSIQLVKELRKGINSKYQCPIKSARCLLAAYSLACSSSRLKAQKQQLKIDPIAIEERYDALTENYLEWEMTSTQFGDQSAVTRGRFCQTRNICATAGSTGTGKVWTLHEQGPKLLTEIKSTSKICDIRWHPRVGSIPSHGPNLLTGSNDGQIHLWSLQEGLQQQKGIKLGLHGDRVNNTIFDHTGYYFFSASYDNTWGLHDATKLKSILTQRGHEDSIHAACLHPDNSLLFTGDLSGAGMVWDIRTGNAVYNIHGGGFSMLCSQFHPNGWQLAISGRNNTVSVYDLRHKKLLHSIAAHTELISDLKYSPDGGILVTASHDSLVKVFSGRDYSRTNSILTHSSKLTSVDIKVVPAQGSSTPTKRVNKEHNSLPANQNPQSQPNQSDSDDVVDSPLAKATILTTCLDRKWHLFETR